MRRMMTVADDRPLIAHIVYRFDTGGLENGLANLVNRMRPDKFRHAIIALTDITNFRQRIERSDVEFVAIGKGAGHTIRIFPALFRNLRRLAPTIVHTRNLAALEASAPAWAAGVPVRIHGEHGREVSDLDGKNRMYRGVRKAYSPFVTHYVALSNELSTYLQRAVGVDARRITQIRNGVDTQQFFPASEQRAPIRGCPFAATDRLVGTVGRLESVKNQPALINAFSRIVDSARPAAERARLVIVGDGPLRGECERLIDARRLRDRIWMAGERNDIPVILRGLHCFVLPSLGEGISNTILEAMASGVPVVATSVGGNSELVDEGVTGRLVAPEDEAAMAAAILRYLDDPHIAHSHGEAARQASVRRFSIDTMVRDYEALYERSLAARRVAVRGHGVDAKPKVRASLHETR